MTKITSGIREDIFDDYEFCRSRDCTCGKFECKKCSPNPCLQCKSQICQCGQDEWWE